MNVRWFVWLLPVLTACGNPPSVEGLLVARDPLGTATWALEPRINLDGFGECQVQDDLMWAQGIVEQNDDSSITRLQVTRNSLGLIMELNLRGNNYGGICSDAGSSVDDSGRLFVEWVDCELRGEFGTAVLNGDLEFLDCPEPDR